MAATVSPPGRGVTGTDALTLAIATALCVAVGVAIPLFGVALALAPLVGLAALGVVMLAWTRPTLGCAVLVAMLTAYPLGRVTLLDVPVYLLDGAVVLVLGALLVRRAIPATPASLLVGVYLASWIPALVYEWLTLGVVLEPLYGFARSFLAVCVFFIGAAIARSDVVQRRVVRVFAGGTLVTCAITVLQAIPPTAGLVQVFLITAAPSFAPSGYERYPERAFAFFQAPTTLAGFLAIAGVLLLGVMPSLHGRDRRIAMWALIAVGPALVATYSRQWVPAVLVGLIAITVLRPQLALRGVAVAGLSAVLVVAALGLGTLDESYLTARFSGEGTTGENIVDRLAQPGEFLTVQQEAGVEVVTGRGFATEDLITRGTVSSNVASQLREGLPTENALLLEIFNHGIVAGLLLVGLLVAAVVAGSRTVRERGPEARYAVGLTAAVVTAIVLAGSDAYLSQSVFMKALMWLLVGWVFGLRAVALRRRAQPSPR